MHQLLPKNRLANICCDWQFPITTNKSIAANFAQESIGNICCDWLFPDLTIATNVSNAASVARESVGKVCCDWLFSDLTIATDKSIAARVGTSSNIRNANCCVNHLLPAIIRKLFCLMSPCRLPTTNHCKVCFCKPVLFLHIQKPKLFFVSLCRPPTLKPETVFCKPMFSLSLLYVLHYDQDS